MPRCANQRKKQEEFIPLSEESIISTLHVTCEALRSNPVFHLSLHSKELFHSNFLAWFCEEYPRNASRVFGEWVPVRETTSHLVERELRDLDLVIELPGLAPFVIENKVFSPPDEAQLQRYSSAEKIASLVDPTLILLSLGSPNWIGSEFLAAGNRVWTHVSYEVLAKKLSEEVVNITGFDGQLLEKYVKFLESLVQLVHTVGIPRLEDLVDPSNELMEVLRGIRMHDAVGKLRARSACASIEKASNDLEVGGPMRFHANFTNGSPLLEGFVECGNGDRLGWQYQQNQWRLAVKTDVHHGRSVDERRRRHEYVAKRYGGWFNFSCLSSILGRPVTDVPPTEAKGEYCGYNPDFVYRYRKVSGLTVGELTRLSRTCLESAKEWL